MRPGCSIIIPCCNEEEGIPALKEKLTPVLEQCRKERKVELLFIDDGSTDGTRQALEKYFGNEKILVHSKNENLGAALRTGLQHSSHEILVFLDADCTYAPSLIPSLLHAIDAGADLALASPYHPLGKVEGVPPWRAFLSQSLSRFYRALLRAEIHTYTGMVRAFRSPLRTCAGPESDFTFVTLMTLRALQLGTKIVEVPAVLTARVSGVSKMRTLQVGWKHLGILRKLLTGGKI